MNFVGFFSCTKPLNHGESARLFNRRKHFVVWNAKWLFRHFRAAIQSQEETRCKQTQQTNIIEFKLIKVMSLQFIAKFVDFFWYQHWTISCFCGCDGYGTDCVSPVSGFAVFLCCKGFVSVRINRKWLNINCGFLNNLSKTILGHPQIYHKWVV